jgi:alpha-amylase/alpha-mannosidase (GH57 family)
MARMIVHGHFYQPPREHPATGEVPRQPSAAPFHDWNERVHAESYKPNAFATVPTPMGELTVNNFERMSFDVGPTLMSWLHQHQRDTYSRILEADLRSVERLGHGNAMAQAYHHTILPLSPLRDVRTQIRWGLIDFRLRFERGAEGMWAPEAAVNDNVLSVMIDEGLRFTVLAPWQAQRWREAGGEWIDARDEPLDTRLPYRWLHPDGSGRAITLFFYDAELSRAIAFDNLASSAERFVEEFDKRSGDAGAVHAATDGETYGHHWRFADLGLAYALFIQTEQRGLEVTNYASLLAETQVRHEVEVLAGGSSWSCIHGVERWAADCGCHTGGGEGWNQTWREPLRKAFDIVRRAADELYEQRSKALLVHAWDARDRYIEVVTGRMPVEEFVAREAWRELQPDDLASVSKLLQLQESAMSMYTSCGWFFNDIGGIETLQVMLYAARTLDLIEELEGSAPRDAFLAKLEEAKSNDSSLGTGADLFRQATSV